MHVSPFEAYEYQQDIYETKWNNSEKKFRLSKWIASYAHSFSPYILYYILFKIIWKNLFQFYLNRHLIMLKQSTNLFKHHWHSFLLEVVLLKINDIAEFCCAHSLWGNSYLMWNAFYDKTPTCWTWHPTVKSNLHLPHR